MRSASRLATGWLILGALAVTVAAAPPHAARPGYRGTDTSGVYPAQGLLKSWPTGGPDLLWQVPLGISAAPVTVWQGKVYAVAGGNAYLHVFDLEGNEVAKTHLGSASWKRFGFTRSTPLVAEGVAFGSTPNANLYGVDLETMAVRWQVNAWADFGAGEGDQGWGLPESPILHEAKVILNPVSRDDQTPPLVAIDIRDGSQVVWGMDPGLGKAYSAADVSAALFTHHGRDLIVSPTWCYIVCLDADTGKVLWEIPSVGEKTLTPAYEDGLLLVPIRREVAPAEARAWPAWPALPLDPPYGQATAGAARTTAADDDPDNPASTQAAADDGAAPVTLRDKMRKTSWGDEELAMLRLSDDGATARVLWVRPGAPGRFSHAVLVDGRVYCFTRPQEDPEPSPDGLLPALPERVRGRSRGTSLVCLDARTGEVIASAPAGTPGHVVAAEGMVYAVDLVKVPKPHEPSARPRQAPRLRLIRPTADGFDVAGELMPFGYDAVPELRDGEWEANVPPVIAEGRLFWKFGPLMVYDLRGSDYEPLPAPPPVDAPPLDTKPAVAAADPTEVQPDDVPRLIAQLGARLRDHRQQAAALLAGTSAAKADELARRLADRVTAGGEEAWLRQRAAAEALRSMGTRAREALPALREALPAAVARRDGTHARLVLATMQAIDPAAAQPAAKPLAALVGHKDPYVGYLAAGLLKRMGPAGADGAGALVQAMPAKDARLSHEAAAALVALGPEAKDAAGRLGDVLLTALKAKRAGLVDRVMDVYAAWNPEAVGPVVGRVADLLRDTDADRRRLAALALSRAGPAAAPAAPALVEALRSEDEAVRDRASKALAAMGSAAEALGRVVAEGQGAERVEAAQVLAQLGPQAAPAVAPLAAALAAEDEALRRAAAKALAATGAEAKPATGALVTALASEDRELVRLAASALGAIGPGAKSAVEPLLAALKHGDFEVRDRAAASLKAIGPSPVPPILEMLRQGDGRDAQWAAGALGRFPDAADRTVGALAGAVEAKDARLAESALASLRALGPEAAKALPALLEVAAGAEDDRRAQRAVEAVGAMGPAAAKAVPDLVKLARDPKRRVVWQAVRALAAIGPAAKAAVEPLVALSQEVDANLGRTIQQTLEKIKTGNRPPTVKDVKATCREGGSVRVVLPIADPDDVVGRLRVHVENRPEGGAIGRFEDGAIVYDSRRGFTGTDRFTYRAQDRGEESSRLATATITVTPDTNAPTITDVTMPLGVDRAVLVTFSEPVTAASAADPANYRLDGGVEVRGASLGEDARTVTLATSPLPERRPCTLTATGIRDRAKAANAGGGQAEVVYRPLVPGLAYRVYATVPDLGDRKFRQLRHVDRLENEPVAEGVVKTVRVPKDTPEGGYMVRWDGVIEVPRRADGAAFGSYTFATRSTGRSRVYIDGSLLVDNRGGGGEGREEERATSLAAGLHAITVLAGHGGRGTLVFDITWTGPGITKGPIPADVLTHPAAAKE